MYAYLYLYIYICTYIDRHPGLFIDSFIYTVIKSLPRIAPSHGRGPCVRRRVGRERAVYMYTYRYEYVGEEEWLTDKCVQVASRSRRCRHCDQWSSWGLFFDDCEYSEVGWHTAHVGHICLWHLRMPGQYIWVWWSGWTNHVCGFPWISCGGNLCGAHPHMEVQWVAHVVIAGSASCTDWKTCGCPGLPRARMSNMKNTFARSMQHVRSAICCTRMISGVLALKTIQNI